MISARRSPPIALYFSFQLAARADFAMPDDAQGTTEILRSALMRTGDDSAGLDLSGH